VLIEGLDVDLTLNFLFKNAHTDPAVLKDIKTAIEGRSNVLHNATIVAHVCPPLHSFTHCIDWEVCRH
jgi:hypothetical protein